MDRINGVMFYNYVQYYEITVPKNIKSYESVYLTRNHKVNGRALSNICNLMSCP